MAILASLGKQETLVSLDRGGLLGKTAKSALLGPWAPRASLGREASRAPPAPPAFRGFQAPQGLPGKVGNQEIREFLAIRGPWAHWDPEESEETRGSAENRGSPGCPARRGWPVGTAPTARRAAQDQLAPPGTWALQAFKACPGSEGLQGRRAPRATGAA